MIHEIQRANSRIQKYVLLIPAIIPFVGLFFVIRDPNELLVELCFLLILFAGCYSVVMYHILYYKQVFYDNTYIYIKSFFGKDQDIITYHDVVELKMHKNMDRRRGTRTAKHTLKYTIKNVNAKAVFYASFYDRQIELLKRQISPEKII